MPLDGHSYLVAQGWGGKGTGLRQGSISRPLAIPQKRTLAGLGKDRDEAFPFWDHLFAAAAKSIQVKIGGDGRDGRDDTSDSDDDASSSQPTLKRTSTGLLSNRRPTHGTPATSGTATPTTTDPNANPNIPPRLSLLATAKREAAKRSLYARFLRGPVVAPVSDIDVIVSQFESETRPVRRMQEVSRVGLRRRRARSVIKRARKRKKC
ncbi:hypothetical protein BD410DRAFT_643449 [Rickenella mellea]|uniref:G-patch domain-containing protein n=1 Tax=Rickenella mellea TaxID=50990 RepID=A0A4Y7PMF1_9AGAM|nr:hypothetical protein BD410DRAFT_643449 [Rickenella mellea]